MREAETIGPKFYPPSITLAMVTIPAEWSGTTQWI